MKQVVYTCARCGKQEAMDANFKEDAPMEWAAIQYVRFHTVQEDGKTLTAQTTCETHACGDCAGDVLNFIESPAHVTENGDGHRGTDQQAIASFTSELMRVNVRMFEGTIRVLSQQNMSLHEQVAALAATNALLCKELEATRPNARSES